MPVAGTALTAAPLLAAGIALAVSVWLVSAAAGCEHRDAGVLNGGVHSGGAPNFRAIECQYSALCGCERVSGRCNVKFHDICLSTMHAKVDARHDALHQTAHTCAETRRDSSGDRRAFAAGAATSLAASPSFVAAGCAAASDGCAAAAAAAACWRGFVLDSASALFCSQNTKCHKV